MQQKQLDGANKVAKKFASNVAIPNVTPNRLNVNQTIKNHQQAQKKIARGLARPIAKPTVEDKIKKMLGL